MEINLADLREMHPRLPEDLALVMIGRAAWSSGPESRVSRSR